MTHDPIETTLWCDAYRIELTRKGSSYDAEYAANAALEAYRKAFPNDPPQTPPAPASPAPAPSFADVFNERDKRREEEEAAMFGAFRAPDPEAA
jgi:hypothetical protein